MTFPQDYLDTDSVIAHCGPASALSLSIMQFLETGNYDVLDGISSPSGEIGLVPVEDAFMLSSVGNDMAGPLEPMVSCTTLTPGSSSASAPPVEGRTVPEPPLSGTMSTPSSTAPALPAITPSGTMSTPSSTATALPAITTTSPTMGTSRTSLPRTSPSTSPTTKTTRRTTGVCATRQVLADTATSVTPETDNIVASSTPSPPPALECEREGSTRSEKESNKRKSTGSASSSKRAAADPSQRQLRDYLGKPS